MKSAGGDAGGKGERAAVRGTRRGWPRRCQGRGTGRSEPTPLPRGGHGTVQYSNPFLPDGHSVHLGVVGPEDPLLAEGVRVEPQVADPGPLLVVLLPLAVAADHAVRDACQAPAVPVPPTPSPHPRTDPAHHRQAKPQTGPGFCLPPGRGPLAPRGTQGTLPKGSSLRSPGQGPCGSRCGSPLGHWPCGAGRLGPPLGPPAVPGTERVDRARMQNFTRQCAGPRSPRLAPSPCPAPPPPPPARKFMHPPSPPFPAPPLPHHHPPAPGSGNGYG